MVISLDRLRPGCAGMVLEIKTSRWVSGRLRDFGMVPGTDVRCRYRSPGGKVTALEVMGAVIAVRTRELKKIMVECI